MFCVLFQILPKVLSQVQSELSEECRESSRHAQIPGESSVQMQIHDTVTYERTSTGTEQLTNTGKQRVKNPVRCGQNIYYGIPSDTNKDVGFKSAINCVLTVF